jgi:hypothetical protein
MQNLKNITIIFALLFTLTGCEAKIKHAKTESYKVWGNCGMCQETIEKAVKQKNTAKGTWDENTKIVILTYDSTKTNADVILKRIALVGYDNDKFIAPDEAYNKRPQCCQYERKPLPISKTDSKETIKEEVKISLSQKETINTTKIIDTKIENQLNAIFENYYSLKNALVKSDNKTTSANATKLLTSINSVKMELLTKAEHEVWMKVISDLQKNITSLSTQKDIEKQRQLFMSISKNMYLLSKVSQQETPTYLQHCPMYNNGKGADWLSKEKAIKNPYYGSQMLTCGSVKETIK